MVRLSKLDTFISHIDNALKTLVPGAATAHRSSPAETIDDQALSQQETQHAAGLMRINHTGEVCAQALYQGQSLTARLPQVRDAMEEAAEEEIDHLVWCEHRLKELNSQPSLLNPLFYGLSYSVGALAGALGDKWSLGFVAATEDQVCKHLEHHLETLPQGDQRSRAVLRLMHEDELRHATTALSAGGVPFPKPVKNFMTGLSKVMTGTTYRI
ncbi:2-polyprenyl-3-methyl-6-methoxy-1,4-benzoquinone monooxygenase [Bermanella sp. R86510]|uniref:2-polyprenyl-3-methyl-6-methoxy-1,4-benzoquinone monooxygenase n=1 Tax=unclassified Bermanella TaxID=2627862 RepID=UPI0037CC2CCF